MRSAPILEHSPPGDQFVSDKFPTFYLNKDRMNLDSKVQMKTLLMLIS